MYNKSYVAVKTRCWKNDKCCWWRNSKVLWCWLTQKYSEKSILEVLKTNAWIKGKTNMLKTETQRKLEVKQVEFKLGEDCWVKVLMMSKYCYARSQSTDQVKVKVLQREKSKIKGLLLKFGYKNNWKILEDS